MKLDLIDLHLHLDGSLSPLAVREMARMSGVTLEATDEQALLSQLVCPEQCSDLNEYLRCFALPLAVMQTEETIAYAVCDLVSRLEEQGLLYAEIRYAPQLHLQRGLSQQQVVEAAIKGLLQATACASIKVQFILCCMRGEGNGQENQETVRLTKQYLGKGVAACDLAGAEALFPSEGYEALFSYARELGVSFTFHAGEACGAESVLAGLSFGAKRIGHGIRCFDDRKAKRQIKSDHATLELCPTSNLHTKALERVTHWRDYPIAAFLRDGVAVTINTDNMTVSNTTLALEYARLLESGAFTLAQAQETVYHAVEAAFLPLEQKEQLAALCKQVMAASK